MARVTTPPKINTEKSVFFSKWVPGCICFFFQNPQINPPIRQVALAPD